MNITVFQRHEIKYLLDPEQRATLEARMKDFMIPDAHGESTICNVYYDTPDYQLIRRSLEKPQYKEKLRIRSYGQATPDETVFLELKKKYDGIVYKRRIETNVQDAERYLLGRGTLGAHGQIGREIESFCRHYGKLQPAVHLCYDRQAFFSKDDPNLRITFDRNIRWDETHRSLTDAPTGASLLSSRQSLLEIKAGSAMPLWLSHALSEAGIRPVSFSKYGTVYQTQLIHHMKPQVSPVLQESRGFCYV